MIKAAVLQVNGFMRPLTQYPEQQELNELVKDDCKLLEKHCGMRKSAE